MSKQLVSVRFDAEDLEALEQLAEQRGMGVATLVRQIVRGYLTEYLNSSRRLCYGCGAPFRIIGAQRIRLDEDLLPELGHGVSIRIRLWCPSCKRTTVEERLVSDEEADELVDSLGIGPLDYDEIESPMR